MTLRLRGPRASEARVAIANSPPDLILLDKNS